MLTLGGLVIRRPDGMNADSDKGMPSLLKLC